METSFKRSHARTAALSAPNPAVGHHHPMPQLETPEIIPCLSWRLLKTRGQDWVNLLWGHCSFLLGPGAHKVLLVPSKSLFLQSCVSWD